MDADELTALAYLALQAYHVIPESERPDLSEFLEQWFSEIQIDPFAAQVNDGELA